MAGQTKPDTNSLLIDFVRQKKLFSPALPEKGPAMDFSNNLLAGN